MNLLFLEVVKDFNVIAYDLRYSLYYVYLERSVPQK
jgi:hypothetical protein